MHRRFSTVSLVALWVICQAQLLAAQTADPMRDLQTAAVAQKRAEWGYWGSAAETFLGWKDHSNRLIPVYTFGARLDQVCGPNSCYRNAQRLEQLYGYLPTDTLNPQAEYFDQTDVYQLQKAAAAAGKNRIILVIFDGMDWQTTWAAATYRTGEVRYREGRGAGLHFQDYRGAVTDFGYFVTAPHNDGTKIDIDAQTVLNPGGTTRSGFDWLRGGATPWATPADPVYLIAKSKQQPHAVTDSSSSATSMTTGIKTYNSAVNLDINGRPVETIAHQLQRKGFSIGVVTDVPFSHATPAAAYSHNVDRDDYQDLTRDLVGLRSVIHRGEPLPGVDVLLGAGWGEIPLVDEKQGANFVPGNRYIAPDDLKAIDADNGGRYRIVQRTAGVDGKEALAAAASDAAQRGLRLLGMFGVKPGHLPYRTADGNFDPVAGLKAAEQYSPADRHENPRLADMAKAALDYLSRDPEGFWVMVEAGDVDWANHDNNLDNSIGAVLDGDEAIKTITDWVEQNGGWDKTILIVTSDHGHYLNLTQPEVIAAAAKHGPAKESTQAVGAIGR